MATCLRYVGYCFAKVLKRAQTPVKLIQAKMIEVGKKVEKVNKLIKVPNAITINVLRPAYHSIREMYIWKSPSYALGIFFSLRARSCVSIGVSNSNDPLTAGLPPTDCVEGEEEGNDVGEFEGEFNSP